MKRLLTHSALLAALIGNVAASPVDAKSLVKRTTSKGSAIFHKDSFISYDDENEWTEEACSLAVNNIAGFSGVFGPWPGTCADLPDLAVIVKDEVNGTAIAIDTLQNTITFTDVYGGQHSCVANGLDNRQGCRRWETTATPGLALLSRGNVASSSSGYSWSSSSSSSLQGSTGAGYPHGPSDEGVSSHSASDPPPHPHPMSPGFCYTESRHYTERAPQLHQEHWNLHKQVTGNVDCHQVGCHAGKSDGHSHSVTYTATLNLIEWISAGLSVTKSVETGEISSCDGKPHDTVCVWKTVPHIAYSARNVDYVFNDCDPKNGHKNYSRLIRVRSPKHGNLISHQCRINKHCHHEGYSFWMKNPKHH